MEGEGYGDGGGRDDVRGGGGRMSLGMILGSFIIAGGYVIGSRMKSEASHAKS